MKHTDDAATDKTDDDGDRNGCGVKVE